jgi:squalene-associated FAD-dependent desaturase
MAGRRRVAVVGGGWAGLAAAVKATQQDHAVTLFDTAREWGGRARSLPDTEPPLDNGQHILIGAYTATLKLMRLVGAAPEDTLLRQPLALLYPDGRGLRLRPGPPLTSFLLAVLRHGGWRWRDRLALLAAAVSWRTRGFRCPSDWTVATLCRRLPPTVYRELIEPLCVAALNTPAAQSSAEVFLRALQDALFSGPGGADLLLPRRPLSDLLPRPAVAWLARQGAELRAGQRVQQVLPRADGRWQLDGAVFDAVVLACSAAEAARLTAPVAPAWSAQAAALRHEPIVTVYIHSPGTTLPQAITALHANEHAPAQYVFDHGQLGGTAGLLAFVISGAGAWVARGLPACAEATLQQALAAFAPDTWRSSPRVLRTLAEKRATFLCTPGLERPPAHIAKGLVAAGDYVAGPYPATLEGAVRSGQGAVALLAVSGGQTAPPTARR